MKKNRTKFSFGSDIIGITHSSPCHIYEQAFSKSQTCPFLIKIFAILSKGKNKYKHV